MGTQVVFFVSYISHFEFVRASYTFLGIALGGLNAYSRFSDAKDHSSRANRDHRSDERVNLREELSQIYFERKLIDRRAAEIEAKLEPEGYRESAVVVKK